MAAGYDTSGTLSPVIDTCGVKNTAQRTWYPELLPTTHGRRDVCRGQAWQYGTLRGAHGANHTHGSLKGIKPSPSSSNNKISLPLQVKLHDPLDKQSNFLLGFTVIRSHRCCTSARKLTIGFGMLGCWSVRECRPAAKGKEDHHAPAANCHAAACLTDCIRE